MRVEIAIKTDAYGCEIFLPGNPIWLLQYIVRKSSFFGMENIVEATLREFLAQSKYQNPDALNIAGYIVDDIFYYLESTNRALPAAIHFLEHDLSSRNDIYTNLRSNHWLRTYLGKKLHHSDKVKAQEGKHALVAKKRLLSNRLLPPHTLAS